MQQGAFCVLFLNNRTLIVFCNSYIKSKIAKAPRYNKAKAQTWGWVEGRVSRNAH